MKKGTKIGIIGLGLLGLVSGIHGYQHKEENREFNQTEAKKIYIERPEFSTLVEKFNDKVVVPLVNSDYCKHIDHPQADNVMYGGNNRYTRYYDEDELVKLKGRNNSGSIGVNEKEIGKDLWKFDYLDAGGYDIPPQWVTEARKNVPWIFEAAENNHPYTLKIERDAYGKTRKLIYNLYDGKKVELEDRDGNCIADKIIFK